MTVRPARADEADVVTELIAAAFVEIPPTAWLIPDDAVRRAVFGPYIRIFVDAGMAHGRIDVAVDGDDQPVAAAVWWPNPVPEPEDYDKRLAASVGQEPLARFAVFDEGMHQMHPTDPHEYLGFTATWPDRQDQGHGTRLLKHRHAELDAAGHSAYLAAASEPARRLYLRLGYADHGEP
ncbi:MAG: GNAT family N-acetyltransferase, partial [Micromonosporaceae bacterium]